MARKTSKPVENDPLVDTARQIIQRHNGDCMRRSRTRSHLVSSVRAAWGTSSGNQSSSDNLRQNRVELIRT